MSYNICFLLRLYPVYGGGEAVTICLANEMVNRGHHVDVLYFKKSTGKVNLDIDRRIVAHKIDGIGCDEFDNADGDSAKAQDALGRFLQSKSIDVVINQWWPFSYLENFKSYSSVKLIHCLHTSFFTPILDDKGWKGILKRCLKPLYILHKKKRSVDDVNKWLPVVDKYVFLSRGYQREYMEMSGCTNSDKLASISNPLVYPKQISEKELGEKENIVLYVGRMVDGAKKVGRAIEAWAQIERQKELIDWKFVIVGDGEDLPKYKELAGNLGLTRVSFEGFRNPLPYYKKAKILLMTSAFEGFPMTLIEAQQNGVIPVVMDTFLSLHDIVKNNYNGIITKDRITSYAERLMFLMKNQVFQSFLSHNAIKSCEKFSVSNIVDKWESLFFSK